MDTQARKKRAPTMSDVAKLAGVHRVTASVVLNNAPASTQVSEATRQRILSAADSLGYHPNAMAMALRQQRVNTIGFYRSSGDMRDIFMGAVMNGLIHGCEHYGKDLLIFGSASQRPPEQVYGRLANGKVDGLVTIPIPGDAEVIDRLADSHLPTVALADAIPNLPSVVVDDAAGTRLLVEHLAAKGHRRILYRIDPYAHTSAVRRLTTFKALAADYEMVFETYPAGGPYGGLSAVEEARLRAAPSERPTAAICWGDNYAYPFLDDCQRMGLRIPDDIAVVGFDGLTSRIKPCWNLTTIRAPWDQVAEKAVEILMALIEGQEVAPETVFPVEFVQGETT